MYAEQVVASLVLYRKMKVIHPEEFSASYRRLVKHDFGLEDLGNNDADHNLDDGIIKPKKRYSSMVLTKMNITRDAMVEDGNNVVPVNFAAVGSMLLEFTVALSDHMGWERMIQDAVVNVEPRRNAKGVPRGGSTSPDLFVKIIGLIQVWGRLLACIDREQTEQVTPEFNLDKVAAFTKSYFDKVEKRRYIFFADSL